MSDQAGFIPSVSQEIVDSLPSTALELGAELKDILLREQPALYKHLDQQTTEAMTLGTMLGACSHCIAMVSLAVLYLALRQQVEANALKELMEKP